MEAKSEPIDKLKLFLSKVKIYRQLSLPEKQLDENYIDFCDNLPEPLSWEALAKTHNKAGENILHLMAVSFTLAPRLPTLKGELSDQLIKALMMEKNNNGETPFHLSCLHLNLPLFDMIVETLSRTELQFIAAYQNKDCAYNAFHLLCLASSHPRVNNFMKLFQGKDSLPEQSLNRYQLGYYNIPDNVYLLIKRFSRVFGSGVDDLIMAVDKYGNNGLMLCCYTCQDLMIEPCLALFTDTDKLYQAAVTALPGNNINPIKLLCKFGTSACIDVLIKNLNRVKDKALVAKICVEQEALLMCHQSFVEDNKRKDYQIVLDLIAEAYGDRLEEGVVMNSGDYSVLIMSLYGDGIIVRKLIDKKSHLHFQNETVCQLFYDMWSPVAEKVNSTSSHFFLSSIKKPPEHRATLTKILLAKIFKIEWPDAILGLMAKAVAAKMPNRQVILRGCDAALIELIIELEGNVAAIPLALFYKVGDHLNDSQQRYFREFQNNTDIMQCLSDFYCELKSRPETQDLAKRLLVRILDSRSILKVAVLQKLSLSDYDRKIREKFADITKIKTQHVNALDQGFSMLQEIIGVNRVM